MNCSGRLLALAKSDIGRVEVFVAKIQSELITASTFLVTSALTSGSSNTASIIKSQSAKAA